MSNINNRHLASHALTAAEYRHRYPDAPLMSEAHAQKLSARSVAANASRKGVPRTQQTKQNMRAGQARYHASHVPQPRGPMSEAQKDLLSELAFQRFADGYVHPNTGKSQPDAVKQKISATLTGRKVGPEAARKAVETKRQRGHDMAPFRNKRHTAETKALIGEKATAQHRAKRPGLRECMMDRIQAANVTLLNDITENVFQLRCNQCGYHFTRTVQMFQPAKFHPEVCDQCYPISPVSQQEKEVARFVGTLADTRVIHSDMELLSPLELDIYIPESQLAIEYCGLYWHSSKPRYYHRHKYDACAKQGIRLLTIFEDEWVNSRSIVESMLRNALGQATRKINARSCVVEALYSEEAIAFLTENHVQGRGRSRVKLGLRLGDELVAVMTFMDSDVTHRGSGWEINRFCSKLGCSVRGGASKLFAAFLAEQQPELVTSFADLRWGEGKVYGQLGFQPVGVTVPNYWYVKPPTLRRYHRYTLRKTASDPADQTEWQLRQQEGWRRLWDCGHAKWVWQSNGG